MDNVDQVAQVVAEPVAVLPEPDALGIQCFTPVSGILTDQHTFDDGEPANSSRIVVRNARSEAAIFGSLAV